MIRSMLNCKLLNGANYEEIFGHDALQRFIYMKKLLFTFNSLKINIQMSTTITISTAQNAEQNYQQWTWP